MSVHSFILPDVSIHPSICLSIYPSIHPSIHVCPSIHPYTSVHPCINLFIHWPTLVCLSIFSSSIYMYSPFHSSIYASIFTSIHVLYRSIYPFIFTSIHLFIHPSIHPFIHPLSIHVSPFNLFIFLLVWCVIIQHIKEDHTQGRTWKKIDGRAPEVGVFSLLLIVIILYKSIKATFFSSVIQTNTVH